MARFIMANRRAGKFSAQAKLQSRESLASAYEAQFAGSSDKIAEHVRGETSRRTMVLEMEPQEFAVKQPLMPSDVIIEPEILHYSETALPLDLSQIRRAFRNNPTPVGTGQQLTFEIRGSGKPLEGAKVECYLRGPLGRSTKDEQTTDNRGKVSFNLSTFWRATALVISPVGGYWRQIVRGPTNGQRITLRRLPRNGYTSWWHRLHGVNSFDVSRGKLIKVGVADTGLGPHPNLSHAFDQGAFIGGSHLPNAGSDVDTHGTHVAGTIGARPSAKGELSGISPGVDLYTARVFPPGTGANQGDIANAIDHLSSVNQCDLINLSLGSEVGSQIEHDAIIDALERGTLCVCAAANDGLSPVNYPARFDETLAISAVGLDGWAPDGSVASMNYPTQADKYGNDGYFLASFSNFGPSVFGIGGGVGIIATVPARYGDTAPFASMDGTSMASPAACGAIAGLLARDRDYLNMPRDFTRAEQARKLIRLAAKDLGLAAIYQGSGAPQVS